MLLNAYQITSLLDMIVTVESSDIGCDECFGRVAEYAEFQLARQPLPEAFRSIEAHLRQCPCCRDEYRALLEGMSELVERW